MREKILNGERATELWEAVKGRSLPSKAVTQAEYDALPEEEKRNGTLYITPGVPSDGGSAPVPTGAVISFLALSAPKGYLICDGAEHPIAEFPGLSRYIKKQFGQVNHFGGDGETTFAVPDMRNLFLRGYHGEAEEQLSGEVGERQEGTQFPSIFTANGSTGGIGSIQSAANKFLAPSSRDSDVDSLSKTYSTITFNGEWNVSLLDDGRTDLRNDKYTSRPVNMAVLYCIKT